MTEKLTTGVEVVRVTRRNADGTINSWFTAYEFSSIARLQEAKELCDSLRSLYGERKWAVVQIERKEIY